MMATGIQAQIGHVSPQVMKTYSHVRRQALDDAAAVLESTFEFAPPAETIDPVVEQTVAPADTITSHVTSQSDDPGGDMSEILKGSWLTSLDNFRNWFINAA
jgi:hypothetical protein